MVAQVRTQLLDYDEFEATRAFLAEFGIAERSIDQYQPVEDDVLRAIRARGWEPSIEHESEALGWRAEIQERPEVSQSRVAIGRDDDRTIALLRALRVALMWRTREEVFADYNQLTQDFLGMSANQFLEKWERNELDLDDSKVIHLLIARPLGW